ncbi:hypothetical protein D3C72_2065800 [compost metagenome]
MGAVRNGSEARGEAVTACTGDVKPQDHMIKRKGLSMEAPSSRDRPFVMQGGEQLLRSACTGYG